MAFKNGELICQYNEEQPHISDVVMILEQLHVNSFECFKCRKCFQFLCSFQDVLKFELRLTFFFEVKLITVVTRNSDKYDIQNAKMIKLNQILKLIYLSLIYFSSSIFFC